MTDSPRAVVLFSGGLDSSTVLAMAQRDGYAVTALSFDYGQRHRIELTRAARVAAHLGAEHRTVQVGLGDFGGSALTDAAVTVPLNETPAGVIPPTYVPGRNTVFIALGLSLAEAVGAGRVYLGINAVDYSGYPDCRPEYLEAYQRLADLATRVGLEGHGPRLVAPLMELSKPDIVREAVRLGVPVALTYSCYSGGEEPCGACDSCRIRDRALREAGYPELASTR